ncbi:MAG TPA: 8-oxoguanine deaminase [Streptosporangiaceae bacterium]|nr:8-oxoguanine deaminase [Streptosporangiaceae bacterium]
MTIAPIVLNGCAVATMDGDGPDSVGTEYTTGHVIVADGHVAVVGDGPAPRVDGAWVVDGTGCLATPGLVNTHHHLYQWLTQGRAQQCGLFGWLTELYPIWARTDPDQVHAAATAGLAWLALTGCTTSTDHHYIFPRRRSASFDEPLAAEIAAAATVGLRFHPCRGSMDLGESKGGLPPDEAVETTGAALAATEAAIAKYHDPSPDAMVRIAVGPCSPFSASEELMREAATLARATGTRLHTHLAETRDEEDQLRAKTGRSPAEYADELGWLNEDVWLAHGVHFDDAAITRLAATGTGVAHCPSSNARLGSGIAPVRKLLAAGAPVGLGVDGPSSGDAASMVGELRQALLAARSRGHDGAGALTARQALWLGTRGGAQCLGRDGEIGALRRGALADVALWRLDTLANDALAHGPGGDPVTALVFGPPAPLALLLVGGNRIVEDGELRTTSVADAVRGVRTARDRLFGS